MFCPKCGTAEQQENTYCRRCGVFLPDFAKEGKRRISPEEHIKSNIVLSAMTIVASFVLSFVLFSIFLGKNDTPAVIYVTAGFLIAIGAWQIQTLWRNAQLKKHFKRRKVETAESSGEESDNVLYSAPARNKLNEPNFADAIPASVVENTTRKLTEKIPRKSS